MSMAARQRQIFSKTTAARRGGNFYYVVAAAVAFLKENIEISRIWA
jgi:hypothetical protein